MKYQLFSYLDQSQGRVGIALSNGMYDLLQAASFAGVKLSCTSIDDLLTDWSSHHSALAAIARLLATHDAGPVKLAGQGLRFKPLLDRPGVIYGAGANYRDHVEAMGRAFNMKLVLDPKAEGVDPWFFQKAGKSTLSAHGQHVHYPAHTQKLDWEAELAVVIASHAHRVSVADALSHVAGFSCANDLSARDNLVRQAVDAASPFKFDWIGHKNFNGSCPLGPFLTPGEFVDNPENLAIKMWLNGELMQDSNTSNHLYNISEQISYLSHRVDLHPGDVILTGTPAGVGMERGKFLKPGDSMKVWIDGLGTLETILD
jgi:2-keto-4-pentenoate hydratase/2-oxohepta-3-ene-1,7-dioic acid hydratase in catechol pathway